MKGFFVHTVIALLLFVVGARASNAYDLPGYDEPEFQRALGVWLSDSDASVRDFMALAVDGNLAATAMILHLTNEMSVGSRPRLRRLEGIPGDLTTIRRRALSNISPPDNVSAAIITVLSNPYRSHIEEGFILLDVGLDDLAYTALAEVPFSRVEELLSRREISDMPQELQVQIYYEALLSRELEYPRSLVDDGIEAVRLSLPRGISYLFAAHQITGMGLPVPDVEPIEERRFLGLYKAGVELTLEGAARLAGDIEQHLDLALMEDEFEEWVMSHATASYIRALCRSICLHEELGARCVRAGYSATNMQGAAELWDFLHPPDGIVKRFLFFETPRGKRVVLDSIEALFIEIAVDEVDRSAVDVFREMSPCLANAVMENSRQ